MSTRSALWEPRRWVSIHDVPTPYGAAVLDRFGWSWVYLRHGWVRIAYEDSPVTRSKAPPEDSGPFTEPLLTFR